MKNKNYQTYLSFFVVVLFFSCQQDQEITTIEDVSPLNYSFKTLNQLSFDFQQKSESILKVIPYSNSLSITNLSDEKIDNIDFGIYAFSKKDTFSFKNLSSIDNIFFSSIEASNSSDTVSLSKNDFLFAEDNVLISIENLNNQNHSLSGSYKGEINIYKIVFATDTTRVFSKSLLSRGTIDYRGKFYFLIEDTNKTDISFIRGGFNASNKVTGSIKNSVNGEYSSLQTEVLNHSIAARVNYTDIRLNGGKLQGDFIFTTNNEQQILEINLTKQN
jgi:hypothetical protein